MHEAKQRFLKELAKEIGNHPEEEHILMDYELHMQELLQEDSFHHQQDGYNYLVQRLGTPREIATLWRQEIANTPHKTQWLFVISNIVIFIGGTLLILGYHLFDWDWLVNLWLVLTDLPFLIIFVYLLFWGLLGYEIGKEFGHYGKRLLRRIFLISVIPNIFIMYVVVLRMIPYERFQSIVNFPSIVICILFTAILYPVSYVGYRWGRKVSI